MIRWAAITVLWLFLSCAVYAQVTGNAFLAGESDHSGIKVKFIPVAGSAALDSTYTLANGSFSANVVGGVYQVVYSKSGFQSVSYQNGLSLALPSGFVLNDVELEAGNNLIVLGTATGTWTNDNIYVVNGDIYIPAGESLKIEEGTQILFNGYYTIIADGALNIDGSNGLPVTIRSNKTNPSEKEWNGIQLLGDGCSIDYAVLEHCDWCVFAEEYSPTISNCTIKNCRSGIYANSTKAIIRKNNIHDFGMNFTSGWGIWVESGGSEALVECNEVHDGYGYGGIITKREDMIRDNHVYNIDGFGIVVDNSAPSIIYNNVVHNCKIGIRNGCPTGEPTNPLIYNNVIMNNEEEGIYFVDYHAGGRVINNIIVGNKYGIRKWPFANPGPSVVENNLFWDNSKNFENIGIPGLGVAVGQNSNGHDIDSYENLRESPQFVTENPPTYEAESPVFGAGDTNYYADLGITGTRECLRTSQPEIEEENDTLSSEVLVFPNPCSEFCSFLISRPQSTLFTLQFFNSLGQLVSKNDFDSPSITIDRGDLAAGVYLFVLSDDLGWRSTHRIVLR